VAVFLVALRLVLRFDVLRLLLRFFAAAIMLLLKVRDELA
jgi:hypothetical protein